MPIKTKIIFNFRYFIFVLAVICVVLLLFMLSMLFCVVLCIDYVQMCTVLQPPSVNPIAVDKYIISHNFRN
jgi:hypothetical protein